MLWQWLLEHLWFTLILLAAIITWAVMTLEDMHQWDNYYKDKDWRKR